MAPALRASTLSMMPIGPWPITRTVSPGLQAKGFNALHAGIYRLDEAGLLERDAVGDADRALLDDPVHHANVFGEPAARRLESGRATDFLIGGALGESLVPAVVALAARDVVKDHDAVAGTELRYLRRRRPPPSPEVSWPKIRGAECDPVAIFFRSVPHTPQECTRNEHLSAANFGDRNGFETNIIDAAVNGRLHGRGNRCSFEFGRRWPGSDHIKNVR